MILSRPTQTDLETHDHDDGTRHCHFLDVQKSIEWLNDIRYNLI